jgi:imidazolonepropionase-like amidohydrolase
VTLGAAHSLRLEEEVGSISPGKLANITVLAENPLKVSPEKIGDIKIWGTVHEGRVFPLQ